jgi:hypothetical protein
LENGVTDELETLVRWYEEAEQASTHSRQEAERDRDYRNGNQWTHAEVETLRKRKQPVITIDRIGPKIDFLLGLEQQQRNDPRAYARTPKEEDAANAASDALNYVLDANRWDAVRSSCFDNFAVEGMCGVDIAIVERYGEMCVDILPIMWDRLFFDPHSRRKDFSDAKYKGQFLWMDLDEASERWPGKVDILETTLQNSPAASDTFDDVPKLRWSDPKRKRIRIVSMWSKEGGNVFYSVFTNSGVLERMETPYRNEHDEPQDGFVFGSCFIDRDGNRFGVVRRWISLQDEINKRRSKAMHLMNVRQTYGNQAIGDKNQLRNELAKPDGHVEMAGGSEFGKDFGVIPTNDMAAAQFQLLQEAKSEIDAVGVNAALSGKEGRVMSGRALMQRSEQGLNELGPVFDSFKQWQLDVYRTVWLRIRQFWTAEKWIRVTDDEKNIRFVGLNAPMTLGDQLLDEVRQSGQDVTPEMAQQAKMDPAMQQVVGVRNNVAQMDVDITVDVVPASASLQIEQFEQLAQMAASGVPIPPDVLILASNLRNKKELAERLTGGGKEQQQIPPQVQQAMQAAEQRIQELQAENQQLQSGIVKAQIESQSRERIAAMNNEASFDEVTLTKLADMLMAKMQPPPQLAAAVSSDLAKQ